MEQVFTIYMATSPKGKHYIGYTSQDLNRRITQHYSAAKTRNSETIFTRALTKYGSGVKWEVLGRFSSKEQALEMEKYYIRLFKTVKLGYNTTLGGESFELSDKGRINMSKSHGAGYFRVYERCSGRLIGTWLNRVIASEELGIDSKRVSDYLNYKRFHKNYNFIKAGTFHSNEYVEWLRSQAPKRSEVTKTPIKVVYPSGKERVFSAQKHASNAIGICRKKVNSALKSGREIKGYRFYYVN